MIHKHTNSDTQHINIFPRQSILCHAICRFKRFVPHANTTILSDNISSTKFSTLEITKLQDISTLPDIFASLYFLFTMLFMNEESPFSMTSHGRFLSQPSHHKVAASTNNKVTALSWWVNLLFTQEYQRVLPELSDTQVTQPT